MKEKILQAVDGAADEAIKLLRDLVRINTVNPYSGEGNESNEREGQALLKDALDQLGGQSVMFDCPDDIYERMGVHGPKGRNFRGRPNLVSEFTLGTGGKTLIINDHMDTVGIADMEFEPFCAELKEGKMLGRGTCDSKGGLVAGWLALKALLSLDPPPNGSIVFESVIDEECNGSGAGTLACLDRGYRGDAAIVLDGYSGQLTISCMGVLTGEVTVPGRGGHSASRDVVSAIDKAIVVKEAIDRVKQVRESACPDAALNLGLFQAGVLPAVVPSSARLAFNLQYDISELEQAEKAGRGGTGVLAKEQVERELTAACDADPWLRERPAQLEWLKELIPFKTDPDAPLVRAMQQAHLDAAGEQIEAGKMTAWCDAAWMAHLCKMPVISFGTSRAGEAHSQHECVVIEDFIRVAKTTALAVHSLLSD